MTVKIVVPESGESVVEATVARWLKQEGEQVSVGEAVVELETDKVNLEVAAEKSGVLAKIERQEGEDVEVGDVLGLIDEQAEAEPKKPDDEAGSEAVKSDETGDEADSQGAQEEGDEEAQERDKESADERESQAEKIAKGEEEGQDTVEKATPVAQRLAQEYQVDLSEISHGDERITRQDVETFLDERQAAQESEPSPANREAEEAAVRDGRPERRERMSRRRQTIAQRLVEAQQSAAMLTTFNEIDMGAVIDLRQRRRDSFADRHGVKLGFMSFFVKAAIGALKAFPILNAELADNEIVYKEYYDIGIAVGAPQGLVVPVLRDAERLSFAEIEQKIKAFSQKAGDNTLSLEDLRGGTFTITNGGVFGSLLSTPILNPPQVGILGLHKIEERPIARNGQVVIRPMMYVALSYDHRLVDGREAVQFLVRLKSLVEDPEELLLAG